MTYKEFEKDELLKVSHTFNNSSILKIMNGKISSALNDIKMFDNEHPCSNYINVHGRYSSNRNDYEINNCVVSISDNINAPELIIELIRVDIDSNISKLHRYNYKNFKRLYRLTYKEDCFICVYEVGDLSELHTVDPISQEIIYKIKGFEHRDNYVNDYLKNTKEDMCALFEKLKKNNQYTVPKVILHAINVMRNIIFMGMTNDKLPTYLDVLDKRMILQKIKEMYMLHLLSINRIVINDCIKYVSVKRNKLTYYYWSNQGISRCDRVLLHHSQYIGNSSNCNLYTDFYLGLSKSNLDIRNYYDNYINGINYMLTDTNRWDCKKRLLMISLICKDEIKNIY